MYRTGVFAISFAVVITACNHASAQVSIRTPFGEVHTGGPAGTVVRAPFVNVRAGGIFGGVNVRAPFVNVSTPPRYATYPPGPPVIVQQEKPPIISVPRQPVPVAPGQPPVKIPTLPQPVPQGAQPQPVVPLPSPSIVLPSRPFSHYEFARSFRPVPGTYVVDFVHPGHRRNVVRVQFTLPPGHPRINCGRKYLEFDYGRCQVEIRFRLFGRVTVDYD